MELLQGNSASDIFNPRSTSVKSIGLEPTELGNDEQIDLIMQEPRRIRRPAVRIGDKVYFGANSKVLGKLLG